MISKVSELPCARIFITSRREPDFAKKFSQLQVPTIKLEAKDSAEDIEIVEADSGSVSIL